MGPSASAGKILQAADDEDDADQQADEQRAVGREGAGAVGSLLLRGERPGDGQDGHDVGEAAQEHGDAKVVFHQGVLALRPAKAEPLLPVAEV